MVKCDKGSAIKPSLKQNLSHFHIVGRAAPTKKNPNPHVYRMSIFARNLVLAKSRFWYFMKRLGKAKRSGGEILACNRLNEMKPTRVKNFGVLLRYDSRTGTHNMYKEFRDLSKTGAISQMYGEMAGTHRARASSIQVIRISEVANEDCRKTKNTQLHAPKLKFPVLKPAPHIAKANRRTFVTTRPSIQL
ncbi:bifunctional 50S ribosomal protein L18Ae-60S ribosomal protein L20 and L18a/Ribosomal protein 50S-L18Ae-60S-L20-60S-L18A/60S ribosomal protein L18a- L20 [Babesia duncani]|uniref:60S ribosomal protein L18a n=1 Tax=Babesia duncani TaxID=323732 RepID=A0AAD9UQ97_9APIC|nr:bifunctional 50S ribosomal protein L18Ae-60S ribosomal protein L20 and L18a/Ribosomal protein 50S-L18Ae-60S-L20-60S-L18A/60S ribosomal protein L18a- L20 [Babesia duncani]